MRILYVEDNLPNIILVERIVSMGKHELIHYPDAETALLNLDHDNPDLVLVDIRLEGQMDGLDLMRHLRARGFSRPIVAITASLTDNIRGRCLEAGYDDFFSKPLSVHRFWRVIQRLQRNTDYLQGETVLANDMPGNDAIVL